jgi:aspartate carbamoyltransferase catalytic subunit
MKSLFTISDLSVEQIESTLDAADGFRTKEIDPSEAKSTVATMFFEPSTRTRVSFEIAAARLGAHVVSFDPATSSKSKGESLRDTAQTIAAIGVDVIVIRHQKVGAPEAIAKWTGMSVVNGGDGRRAHPTQTLADLLTIRDQFGSISGLKVGLVGDIENSRVARGLIDVLPRMQAHLCLIGPPTFLPFQDQISTSNSLDKVLPELDVVYLLRVQKERGGASGYPSDREYRDRFGLTSARLDRTNAIVMHPGPLNRGVEIDGDVADGERSRILTQVSNGVLVRMAVLESLMGDG